ncbi:MAG: protoheme IX farnesyltransferase [Micavibrio sp.]|nr:protoheme IX farnesyltransferase [Micavibrio sp.]
MNSRSESLENEETYIKDYFDLLKPRVMTLVVFTGICGMLVAPGFKDLHPLLSFVTIMSLAFGAGAAGAINMWYDRDIDAIMKRTKNRPIPSGRVPAAEALGFAVVVSLLSVMMMGMAVNWVAAGILAFANIFYSVIYTMWLKRFTPQNIVIGGAAGAFPPMIGWAAVTGDITMMPILLFLIIFFWTPPHFWALALYSNEDFTKAGLPMLPVTHGAAHTKWQMLIYTCVLVVVTLLPYVLGYTGLIYGVSALVLGGLFLLSNVNVLKEKHGYKQAKLMFGYSIFYLFAIFGALVIDRFV